MEAIFWGGIVRFGQATLAGAPTLLVGLLVAGVFRRLLGPEKTLQVFGGNTWRSLTQAWLWGMLLPVCSLGVIPIAYELRRCGLTGGAILAFALTAPLFNPLSLLYGLTLSEPVVLFTFAGSSLLVVTTVGYFWDYCFPNTAAPEPPPAAVPPGLKRILSVGTAAAGYLAGPTLWFCLIGLAGSMLLSAIFPHSSLTDSMAHDDPTSPLLMLLVAIPAFATPLNVMMQVGSMFVHGNSVGAAYVLLALGAGVNLGLIAWAAVTYGIGRSLVFLSTFVVVVLGIAYAIENPLYSAGQVDHPHTHAFDVYACPFAASQTGLSVRAVTMLRDGAQPYETMALSALGLLLMLGLAIRTFDPQNQFERFLESAPEKVPARQSMWNAPLPGSVLGAASIAGLILLSGVGCYIYYPPSSDTLEEMAMVRADALSAAMSKNREETVKAIERYDDLTRRLQVGYYLRHWELDEFQRMRAKILRGRLEQLKDVVEAGEFDRVSTLTQQVTEAHRRCREVFEPAQLTPVVRHTR